MRARVYQGVQLMAETALEHWGEVQTAAKDLPAAYAFLLGGVISRGPKIIEALAPRAHDFISKATDEQITSGLQTALTVIHSILDESQSIPEDVTPDGSSHDGATIEDAGQPAAEPATSAA